MKIPARCNQRNCQTRRNLNRLPEQYIKWPICNMAGCDGKMYVDTYRMSKGAKDHPPLCKELCYPYPHRVDSPNCVGRTDYVLGASLADSKHSPHQHHDTQHEAPF